MIYGQLQYYSDEIKAWARIADFHKGELHDLLTQLSILLTLQSATGDEVKSANGLIDQLILQEQQFDHIHHHFKQQTQRLAYATIDPEKLDPALRNIQEMCRNKIRVSEAAFIKTRYKCSMLLSGFFFRQHVTTLAG